MSQNYEKLDRPEVLSLIFHPRKDDTPTPAGALDRDIVVEEGITVGARFFPAEDKGAPIILFFHGNGEVVSDYDDLGRQYMEAGINFLAVDYRGYGRSQGEPTVSAMFKDAHTIYDDVVAWLSEQGRTGHLIVMGRSLGSVSAIDLAASEKQEKIAGLIIESGIAQTMHLLLTVGVDVQALGISEEDGFGNLQKMPLITKPTYILHAQHDQIIPLELAEGLQMMSGARAKEFQMVPGADHNNILEKTGRMYVQAMKQFTKKVGKPPRRPKPGVRG